MSLSTPQLSASADLFKLLYAICVDQDKRIKDLTERLDALTNNLIKMQLDSKGTGVVNRPAKITINDPNIVPPEVKSVLDKAKPGAEVIERNLSQISQFL
jgi:hypothetical protein